VIGLLAFLHQRFAFALILFAAALGVWGSFGFLTRRQISPGFRSSYVLMIALTAVQGGIGLILVLMQGPDGLFEYNRLMLVKLGGPLARLTRRIRLPRPSWPSPAGSSPSRSGAAS